MRAVITLLVLLLSMCGSQTRSTQTEDHTESQSTGAAAAAAEVSTQLDVSAELRELREMVVELRVTLRFTQNDLRNTKDLLYKIETENDAQDREMTAVTTEMKNLIKYNLAQEAELTDVKTRLAVSEIEVVNLGKEAAAQTADLKSATERLAATETDMEAVKKDTADQHTDLTTMKTEVMNLKMELSASETEVRTCQSTNEFFDYIADVLKQYAGSEMILMGDFNLN